MGAALGGPANVACVADDWVVGVAWADDERRLSVPRGSANTILSIVGGAVDLYLLHLLLLVSGANLKL